MAIILSAYLVVRLFSRPGSSPFYYRCKKRQTDGYTENLFFLILFLFSFLLWIKLGLFLMFLLAFVLFSLITHIFFSLFESELRRTVVAKPRLTDLSQMTLENRAILANRA